MSPSPRTVLAALGLCLSLIAAGAPAAADPDPLVRTSLGDVAGQAGAVMAFKGLPYAAPPVGPLRWRPPQPAQAWSGVRPAKAFGHDCMQTPYVIPTGQTVSEDCLTANVWTPALGNALRPVMVFIYGGGFIGGSGAYPLYDGEALARQGVVVVSFNYRVGVFGFLAHPALSAESPNHASGNYGLLDQVAALQWVKANIAAFGGDPDRVTVFGESAGANSIAFLMTSPLAKGLFEGAILQSPAFGLLPDAAAAETAGAAALGPDLAALRAMSAETLLTYNDRFAPAPARGVETLRFPSPTIDGWVLPIQPRRAFASGAVQAVPTLIGDNAEEGRMFAVPGQPATVAAYQAWAKATFGDQAAAFLALYPAATPAEAQAASTRALSDGLFDEPARQIARGLARRQPRTYAYLFTHPVAGAALPPTHSEELAYAFGSLDQPSFIAHAPPNAADLALSRTMMAAWARFAAVGDPNGAGLAHWPAYDPATDPYLELGDPIRPGQAHRKAQLDFMQRFLDAPAP